MEFDLVMGSPSYLIAKYVADLFRNEPKNIGIIVWLDGFTEARFLATADGKVNGRYLPDSINVASYRQWIEYWTKSIAKEKFKEIGTSKQIERASPEFLDALLSTGSGNYVLERGGELLEEVEPSGLGDVACGTSEGTRRGRRQLIIPTARILKPLPRGPFRMYR